MFPLSRAAGHTSREFTVQGWLLSLRRHRMQTPAGGSRRSLTFPHTPRLLQRCRHYSRQVPGTHTLATTAKHHARCRRCWEQVKQPFLHGCVQMCTPEYPLPALQFLNTRHCHRQTHFKAWHSGWEKHLAARLNCALDHMDTELEKIPHNCTQWHNLADPVCLGSWVTRCDAAAGLKQSETSMAELSRASTQTHPPSYMKAIFNFNSFSDLVTRSVLLLSGQNFQERNKNGTKPTRQQRC